MFPTLQIDSFYTSEDNIIESFLRPVLMEAVSYDRVSAYFTAGALAAYADGLEMFGFAGHKYRLIVSKDISPEDFAQIQIGVAIRKSLTDAMLKDLRAIDSLAVEKGLSNLARLLALGIVEIKIAFKRSGIFHDKFGILKDEMGNRIKFTGSNNETVAAISSNHESFSVVCSWMDKNGFYTRGIDKSQRLFEAYWRGGYGQILVRDVDDVLLQEIMRHDKGKMIEEAMLLKENACILDIQDGRLYLQLNLPDNGERLKGRGFVRIKLRRYLDKKGLEHVGKIVFKEALEYVQFKEIDKLLRKKIPEEGYSYVMTERLREQIEAKDIHIAERSTLGLDIKRRDKRIKERFDEFASVVDKRLERRLRERQMWDAFFMMSMRKSGNFSVPGSGKTSSVLGMFAFLQEKAGIKRILMIGPKNSFGSWRDEFQACFGDKQPLRVFDIHGEAYVDNVWRKHQVKYRSNEYNLMLFNYESLGNWESELCQLASDPETMLVFDEVHKVKNPRGKRASSALHIAQGARYVTVMTGTPIPNGYIDIYNMLHLMFPSEYQSFFGFKEYELLEPNSEEQEEINRKLRPFYCRTTKEQLEVPPVNQDAFVHVKASKEQDRLFYILKQVYGRKNMLPWFWRILQLESDPQMLLESLDPSDLEDVIDVDADDIEEIDFQDYSQELVELVEAQQGMTPKMTACIRRLEELVRAGKTAICWCIFCRSIRNVRDELRTRGIRAEFIDGSTEQEQRQYIIESFRNHDFDVLITNPHTLAESVSLHSVCHDAVYLEYSYNLVHLLQSKDRIHRLGLKEGQYTQYHYMMTDFQHCGNEISFDEKIYRRLREKEELMLEAINDDHLEKMSTSDEDLEMLFQELF